jgi:peroxiredoxin
VRLGYNNIQRLPHGYFGWRDANTTSVVEAEPVRKLTVGDFFPACQLILLNSKGDTKYLQIKHNDKAISLEDVQSEYIFIELYNELCHQCLQEVKNYKSLHSMLNETSSLQNRVKMMGIGVGSKKRHVVKFRRQHGIEFPLFADEKSGIFACLGKPTLPTAYLVQRDQNGARKIIFVQSGHIRSTQELLGKVKSIVAGTAQ